MGVEKPGFIRVPRTNILDMKEHSEVLIGVACIRCVEQSGQHTSICIDTKAWVTTPLSFDLVCELIRAAGGQIVEGTQ